MTRVQRRRAKGAKLPPGTKCCTRDARGCAYANPYRIELHGTGYYRLHITDPTPAQLKIYLSEARGYWAKEDAAQAAVDCFRQWLDTMTPEELAAYLEPLREWEHLACWCGLDSPCHVDVLLEKLTEQ